MRIRNLAIRTQLVSGMLLILALVGVLGITSFRHSRRMWQVTSDLYSHPYQVSKSVRDVLNYTQEIHRMMKDVALDEGLTSTGIDEVRTRIDSLEALMIKEFDLIAERYLGPRDDLEQTRYYLNEWKEIRDDLIRTRIADGRNAAHIRYEAVNNPFVMKMTAEMRDIIDFSTTKADSYFSEALNQTMNLERRMLLLVGIILLATLFITAFLLRMVQSPIKELTSFADSLGAGRYNSRSGYSSDNEIGRLAGAMNSMAEKVESEMNLKDDLSPVTAGLMKHNDVKSFSSALLGILIEKTGSLSGAVYLLDNKREFYVPVESQGISAENLKKFNAVLKEGELRGVLESGKISLLKEIPAETVFQFPLSSGTIKPVEIITIPVSVDNEIVAVVSLSSARPYSGRSLRMIDELWLLLSSRMTEVLHYEKIKEYSALLDVQNRELNQKTRELAMQADEMKEYNIELELQKKQLDEANRLKSAFLSSMSHELRTPLNSVIALSGVLIRKLTGKAEGEDLSYLEIIERNGKSLLMLINDILDLSRIEAGKEEIHISGFSLRDILTDIIESVNPLAEQKNIRLRMNFEDDHLNIMSDRNKCHHIFQNIISNAVKFSEKGEITVTGYISDGNLIVKIKDQGIGIPEDFLPFLFDEFRQADDKTSKRFGGTGLGLAIVKKYCDLIKADVSVRSRTGEGSEFIVRLPLTFPGYGPDENEIKDSIKGVSGKGTILVIEDSEPQIIQLNDILVPEGYSVQTARNGREAIDLLKNSMPDAIILDLHMPEVDGFEVLRTISRDSDLKSVPILILTAKQITSGDLKQVSANNIYQLIQKGNVGRRELLAHIRKMTEMHLSPGIVKNEIRSVKLTTKPSVLLIEDNNDNIITVKALIGDSFEIHSAERGKEGIGEAIRLIPDLILLDISLPDMDGYEVFDKIRKEPGLDKVPVIALTARAMKGDRENLLDYGFDGYISKPVDSSTFADTLKSFFNV